MAFLHRVVNGGGSLEREYAIGSDRMDLCLRYGKVTLGIELKVWRDTGHFRAGVPPVEESVLKKGDPLEDGLEQLESYLARSGENFGWLIIFDRRSKAPSIEERLSTQVKTTQGGRSITVVRA
ncbi:hypothetical protein NIES267_09480 [Calothrix parasitica NIES-267]|uniref:Uncharacterized protein n=1 Tax=Calothrix parasitica NIES-267 TaxID=1973488 RepID=A0A1Z4LJS4_9CYAN|nr:hypothetical protein NIES267_09480 [Calothrix parasitica NIES-267]